MSTLAYNQLQVTRWTLSGASSNAQGADGVRDLVTSAYADMLLAQWQRSDDAPSFPVHEYDRERPSGDAYRATYGYDAATRTERSCCGAVCYVVKIPSDASGSAPDVAVKVTGDRYVESNKVENVERGGVNVYAFLSDSASPVAFDAIAGGATASDLHICVPATTDAQDRPIAPNDREGVTEGVTLGPTGTGAFLHIYLRMADYEAHRGAWVEGGALVAIDTLELTWDAAVTPDGYEEITLPKGFANGGGVMRMVSGMIIDHPGDPSELIEFRIGYDNVVLTKEDVRAAIVANEFSQWGVLRGEAGALALSPANWAVAGVYGRTSVGDAAIGSATLVTIRSSLLYWGGNTASYKGRRIRGFRFSTGIEYRGSIQIDPLNVGTRISFWVSIGAATYTANNEYLIGTIYETDQLSPDNWMALMKGTGHVDQEFPSLRRLQLDNIGTIERYGAIHSSDPLMLETPYAIQENLTLIYAHVAVFDWTNAAGQKVETNSTNLGNLIAILE